jgi:hypothetical protein
MGRATMTSNKDVDCVSCKMLTGGNERDQGGTYRSTTCDMIKPS